MPHGEAQISELPLEVAFFFSKNIFLLVFFLILKIKLCVMK